MIDRESFTPFVLFEYDHAPGQYCLMLTDGEMEQAEDVFEVHNVEPNGHGWNGFAESVAHSHLPDRADRFLFDSEAGTFVVTSTDLDALSRLATHLHQAFHDHEVLDRLLAAASPELLS